MADQNNAALPLAVWSAALSLQAEAVALAEFLSVSLLSLDAESSQKSTFSYLLVLDKNGCSLQQNKQRIAVDFVAGASRYRRLQGGGRGQPVAKAVGLKAGNIVPSVLDATAGLGGDAFVLASLGCTIRLCERSRLAFVLLNDGIQRAKNSDDRDVQEIVARMHLLSTDAVRYMQQLLSADATQEKPDVVFLDPMFPEKRKNAAAKKTMTAFHALVGADEDADALLPLALQVAQRRVVVKRPRHAPVLAGIKPSLVLEGESTRFDIYALRSMAMD